MTLYPYFKNKIYEIWYKLENEYINYIISANKTVQEGGISGCCVNFLLKNFKSYKETTTFDFQATSIPEFSESLLKSEKADALLP